MPDLDIHVDHLGETRKLGYVPPDPSKQKLRATRTNIQTIRQSAGLSPLIAQTDWTECDYVTGYSTDLILNQGKYGACVGYSGAGGLARQIFIRTGQVLQLSGAYLYDQINGGSDNGANIIDSMGILEQVGIPLANGYSTHPIFKANQPTTGTLYKEDVAITVGDALECATALLMGFLVQAPIFVTNARRGVHDFEEFTADGVAWGGIAPKGNASNHSIYLGGLKKIANTWFFRMVNSWGVPWGPFKNGTCLIPLAAIDNPAMADDGYAHASTPLTNVNSPTAVA